MKLTIFQSGKGDCLLLTSKGTSPKRILIDGGMYDAYTEHVSPALGQLQQQGKNLDQSTFTDGIRKLGDVNPAGLNCLPLALGLDTYGKPPSLNCQYAKSRPRQNACALRTSAASGTIHFTIRSVRTQAKFKTYWRRLPSFFRARPEKNSATSVSSIATSPPA